MILFYTCCSSLLILNFWIDVVFHLFWTQASKVKKQTQAAEGILRKLRFRDDELKTWQISKRAIKIPIFYSRYACFHGSWRCLKMEMLGFFSCWVPFVVIFCFSWQRMVPVSIKLLLGRSVQVQVICHAGVGFSPLPSDTPQSSSTLKIHDEGQ